MKTVAVWINQIALQKADCQQDKSYRNATAPLCHTWPLDKSDFIGIETCYVFHCGPVSSSDIFGIAVSISRTKKDWRKSLGAILQINAIETDVPKISNDDTVAQ